MNSFLAFDYINKTKFWSSDSSQLSQGDRSVNKWWDYSDDGRKEAGEVHWRCQGVVERLSKVHSPDRAVWEAWGLGQGQKEQPW